MKILKNKFMLSLGASVAIVAPIASVVACGESPVQDISDQEKEQRETLKKSQQFIQTKYQEYLIAEISKTHKQFGQIDHSNNVKNIEEADLKEYANLPAEFKDEITKFIKRNIYYSSTYLTSIADKLLHTTNPSDNAYFKYNDLVADKFYKFYLDKAIKPTDSDVDNLVKKYIKVIWKENVNNFKNSFYQYVISNYYLDTNKTNWENVFKIPTGSTEKLVDNEGLIKNDQFVLGLKTLRAKLAFDWSVSLSDTSSKSYANMTKTESEIDTELSTAGASIYKATTSTAKRSLVSEFIYDASVTTSAAPESTWNFVKENDKIIGFNGIVSKAAFATNIKSVKDQQSYDDEYVGYVNPESTSEIIKDKTTQIKLTTPKNSKVSLEKIVMILPRYVGSELNIDSLKSSNKNDEFDILKQIIIANDSSIYNEAINYYSSKDNHEFNWDDTKKTGGIRLKFSKEAYELEKLAIDSFKFAFVEKNED